MNDSKMASWRHVSGQLNGAHWNVAAVRAALVVCLVATGCPPAAAGEFSDIRQLSQDAFLRLSKDLAAVTALRALSPGVTLSLLGFDLSVEVGVTNVNSGGDWTKAGGGSTQVIAPRLSLHKGLIAGLDVGASIGILGNTGAQTIGGILRYQVIEPGTISPGATVRLTANKEFGSSSVSVRSFGADFVVAKPLLFVTPYIGLGTVRTRTSAPGTPLTDVSVNRTRTFVGFDTRLAFATVSAEAEKIGETTTVSSKIGFRF